MKNDIFIANSLRKYGTIFYPITLKIKKVVVFFPHRLKGKADYSRVFRCFSFMI